MSRRRTREAGGHNMIETASISGWVFRNVSESMGITPTRVLTYGGAVAGTGLAAVAVVGGLAGKAFYAFTPVPPPGGIDRLLTALGSLGRESQSQRIARQMTTVYRVMIGLITAKTLKGLHDVGARDVRDNFWDKNGDPMPEVSDDISFKRLYQTEDGSPIAYYGSDPKDHTLWTQQNWELQTATRGVMNIMLGMFVYASHLAGVANESGDTTMTINKILKILCYEEVMCRLLKLHGYGALSNASYAISHLLQTEDLPWGESHDGIGGVRTVAYASARSVCSVCQCILTFCHVFCMLWHWCGSWR